MGDEKRDVIEVLKHDHREVEEMFDDLAATTDADERRRITDDVTIELVRHSIAEEIYLYPAVREIVPDGDQIADREIGEHAEVERILKELERLDAAHESFNTLVNRLIENVSAHVEDEEGNLFPKLAEHADADQLMKLGDKVQSAKRVAP
ncbi:hemerythrin domain-containing protein, partial [Actinomadura sp. KC06]|uniref:hemerythrin domain-containing protein n=1 Tax=Actinomadura sp. KC06 TaxID=2530369 RepID=UPI001048BCFA